MTAAPMAVSDSRPALSLVEKAATNPDLLTIDEVAALLRASVVSIRRRVKCGDIPAFRVLGRGPWLFRKDDVLRQLTPVQTAPSPTLGSKASTPPTEVDWLAGLTGTSSPKVHHGS